MSDSTINLTEQNFEETLKQGGIMLIDFWAEWCGPCRSFAPIYDASAKKHPEIKFGKVNTDEQQSLAAAFEVRGIPTLVIFRDGVMLFSQAGALPAAALENLIDQVVSLDMAKVNAEIEKAKKEEAEAPKAKA